jgi:hypothetical protein
VGGLVGSSKLTVKKLCFSFMLYSSYIQTHVAVSITASNRDPHHYHHDV